MKLLALRRKLWKLKFKVFLGLTLWLLFVILISSQFYKFNSWPTDTIWCFDREWEDLRILQNIRENPQLRPSSENIFFHDTSCSDSGEIRLTSRQACAVESAGALISFIIWVI